jgi:hypothetical protein
MLRCIYLSFCFIRCDRIVLGMIATRTFLAVDGILAVACKVAKDRLIVLLGGMVAMQRLTLNPNHCQSSIQNTREIWREEEEKAAILLESWLQCLSYWNSFVRISCLHLIFVGRQSSVDKTSANPAARLAPWVGRPPEKYEILTFVVDCLVGFRILRQKAVFWKPLMRFASNVVDNYRRGGPYYWVSLGLGRPVIYVTG